jgi:ribonuclease HI
MEYPRTSLIEVWTDGSSHASGNKPGGWAYIIAINGAPIIGDYGGHPSTTNNVMELTAALEGLWALERYRKKYPGLNGCETYLVSDSQYALGIADGSFHPSKNIELATEVRKLYKILKMKNRWVKGHNGMFLNEAVDKLAVSGKKEIIELLKDKENEQKERA